MTVQPNPAPAPGVQTALNGLFPERLDRFNWGAFFFTWIWALNHKRNKEAGTYIALWAVGTVLQFTMVYMLAAVGWIPLLTLFFYAYYLGKDGNMMAWESRSFENIEQFTAVQRRWALWGFGLLAIPVLTVFFVIFALAANFS